MSLVSSRPEPWDIWYGYPDEGDYLADEAEREAREAQKWAHYGYDGGITATHPRRTLDRGPARLRVAIRDLAVYWP